MVSDDILKLKHECNEITTNPILESISVEMLKYFESYSKTNTLYNEKIAKIAVYIKTPISIDISEAWKGIYNEYVEACAYCYCSSKLYIERVAEADTNRPDFKIKYNGKEYFLEVKGLFYLNTELNYRKVQEEGLAAKIDIETQIEAGEKVAISMQEFSPYDNGKEDYEPTSKIVIIRGIIRKIEQNYKAGQYELGNTILYIDLRQLGISTKAYNAARPVYIENVGGDKCICSGELWNAVFAQKGNNIIYSPQGFPYGNVEGVLDLDGILIQYPLIRGVIFQTESMHTEKYTLVGFAKYRDYETIEILKRICNYVNDSINSQNIYLDHYEDF